MKAMTKLCIDCSNCLLVGYGCSNYTIEGTTVICMAEQQDPFDHWYGKEKRLEFAGGCSMYSRGNPEELDVDGDGYDLLSDRAKGFV